MFRSLMTVITELYLYLAKGIFMLKHSVKLHLYIYIYIYIYIWGTAVAQWLRCCATNRKVAGSIPDGVIGIFH